MQRTPSASEASKFQHAFSTKLNRVLLIPLCLLALLAISLLLEVRSLTTSMDSVDHTDQVIAEARQMLHLFVDMETGLRGYELTGNQEFLQPYDEADKVVDSEFSKLSSLISNNHTQRRQLEDLREVFTGWRTFAIATIMRRQAGTDVSDYALNAEGKVLMDKVRHSHEQFVAEEDRLRTIRVRDAGTKSKTVIGISLLLVVVIGGILLTVTRRQMLSLGRSYSEAAEIAEARAAELERLSAIVQSSDDAIVGKTLDGTITSWNPGAERLYGYTEQEMLGQSLHKLSPPDRPDELHENLAKLARGERIELYQTKRLRKDGTWVDVETRISPIFDAKGNVTGASSTAHDITERIRTEEALKQSEDRFRRIFEMTADLVCVADIHGAFLMVNAAGERILGYSREELISRPFMEFVVAEDRDATMRVVKEKLERGETLISFENRYRRKDGGIVWLDWTSQPLDEHRTLAVGRDVTERKLNEQALRESEKRFRALSENIPHMTWVADSRSDFSYLSGTWLEYTGTTFEENSNGGWAKLLHPDDVAGTTEKWKTAVTTRGVYQAEYRLRRADGEYRWQLARGVPIVSESGETLWFGTTTDIQDQKRAQEALMRTEKLASVGRMAATVAHEINNPLELITNSVYLATLDESLSEQTREALAVAEGELERVAHLTRQTLGFYRENAAPAEFDLPKLVQDVVAIYAPKFVHKNIIVESEHGSDLKVNAIAGEIRQVVSNLISNSIDATRGGRVRVRTKLSSLDGTRRVQLTVADTGEGIAPENLKHLFEPFFTTKEKVGTGLGLWVSSEIIRRHHGRIRVRSRVGRGTVFSVLLPQVAKNGEADRSREETVSTVDS